ncbi:hypothetical protein ABC345_18045 [Shouchella sp. 1P09AA]|uniref:hypothetical protein n=1 Tax=unclassified Shouchella TaxID=2893065 RepID=UPI0039A12565
MEIFLYFGLPLLSIVLFISLIIYIYKLYLVKIHKWFATFMLSLYPVVIFFLGVSVHHYGRILNSEEIEQRVQAGEEIVYGHFGELIHGPGEMFMLYGSFVYALAIYPVIFTAIFLILINALRKKARI